VSPFRSIWEAAELMVLVRCLRCRKPVAQYFVEADGTGEWRRRDIRPCRCGDPPPVLPSGDELEELVALGRARRDNGFTDMARAPVSVSR
jgi:hypothetical protein